MPSVTPSSAAALPASTFDLQNTDRSVPAVLSSHSWPLPRVAIVGRTACSADASKLQHSSKIAKSRVSPCADTSSVDSSDMTDPFEHRSASAPVARLKVNMSPRDDRRSRGHQTSKSLIRAASLVCAPYTTRCPGVASIR
jgi:hypothetical protein